MRATALTLTGLLLAASLLVPVTSAGWTQAWAFERNDSREVLDWVEDENGDLLLATRHEREHLLFERVVGNETAAFYARPSGGTFDVAVTRMGDEWGLVYYQREWEAIVFAWPENVDERDMAEHRILNDTNRWMDFTRGHDGRLHFVNQSREGDVYFKSFEPADGEWEEYHVRRETQPVVFRAHPDGRMVGVTWNTSGAYAVDWEPGDGNGTDVRLSPYWDYQDARVAWRSDGTLGILVSHRRTSCDYFELAPGAATWTRTEVPWCPLTLAREGLQDFHVGENGRLWGLTDTGIWNGTEELERFPCAEAPSSWKRYEDERELMIARGPTVWTRDGTPAPNVTVEADAVDALVGETVTFNVTDFPGDFEDAEVTWSLGDGTTGKGPSVTHAFTEAGTWTVTATVSGVAAECSGGIREGTLAFTTAHPPEPEPEVNATVNETEDVGQEAPAPEDEEDEPGFLSLPAPAVPLVILAAGLAARARRHGRGAS